MPRLGRHYDMRSRHTLWPNGCPNKLYHFSPDSHLRCNISDMYHLGRNTADLIFMCGNVHTIRFTTSFYKTITYRIPKMPSWNGLWSEAEPNRDYFIYTPADILSVTALHFLDDGNMNWTDAGIGEEFM